MGCDIHLFVEQFDPYSKSWVCNGDDTVDVARNYSVFAMLANVRNDFGFKPISMPRGLPHNVSPLVRQESDEHWGLNGHSHSYLKLSELKQCDWSEYDERATTWLADTIPILEEIRGKLKDDLVRIVFWFDC